LDVVTILVISTAAVATILAMLSMCFLTGRRAVAWPSLTRTSPVVIVNQETLEEASKKGDEEAVKALPDKGANINVQGRRYGSALQVASALGDEQIVKLLLEKGSSDDQIADQTSSDARPRSAKSPDSLGVGPERSSDKE
jgi:ankyrin repeat protein